MGPNIIGGGRRHRPMQFVQGMTVLNRPEMISGVALIAIVCSKLTAQAKTNRIDISPGHHARVFWLSSMTIRIQPGDSQLTVL